MNRKPQLNIEPTTLWDYPSQHYGDELQGDPNYRGATPSYIIWNLLKRYTKPGQVVLDPCCGSGTTLDVCSDLKRVGIGFDLQPQRDDIQLGDIQNLEELEDASTDFIFVDPPYSTHLTYSDDPRCIGKTSAADGSYYRAMRKAIDEMDRVLKPNRYMALYVSDSYVHDPPRSGKARKNAKSQGEMRKGFFPIGFELFQLLRKPFIPIDIIAVTRHNKTMDMGNYRKAAVENNYFLRGFNYLFIMKKPGIFKKKAPKKEVAVEGRGGQGGHRNNSGHGGHGSQARTGNKPASKRPRSDKPAYAKREQTQEREGREERKGSQRNDPKKSAKRSTKKAAWKPSKKSQRRR